MHPEHCPIRTTKTFSGGDPSAYCANGNLCVGEACDFLNAIEEVIKLKGAVESLGNRIVGLEDRIYRSKMR